MPARYDERRMVDTVVETLVPPTSMVTRWASEASLARFMARAPEFLFRAPALLIIIQTDTRTAPAPSPVPLPPPPLLHTVPVCRERYALTSKTFVYGRWHLSTETSEMAPPCRVYMIVCGLVT